MAIATSNAPPVVSESALVRVLMSVYRFLASLKLAVISIATLAAVLAFGTWFERDYGTVAVQQYVYQSVGFSILLAFLAINILCAATIRFPWTKRQTGFVVTHVGLEVLILGSWVGFQYSDEGQVAGVEDHQMSELIRTDSPMIRLREVDPKTGKPIDPEYAIPFKGGAFDWPNGKYEVISQKKDPFKLAVKQYFAASIPKIKRAADPSGTPMLRLRPLITPPGQDKPADVFPTENEQWLTIPADIRLSRISERAGPARFIFYHVDRLEMVDDFLKPPANPGTLGVARLHYNDKAGARKFVDVRIDDLKPGQAVVLPDSDLSVVYGDRKSLPIQDQSVFESLGDSELNMVEFSVKQGDGAAIKHTGFASLPMIPSVIPAPGSDPATTARPIVDISYYLPPRLSAGGGMGGTFGVIEVLGDPEGKLYYRVYGRDDSAPKTAEGGERPGVLRVGPAPLAIGESITAFGGNKNMPVTMTFTAESYLPRGRAERVYESFDLPVGKKGTGLAAAQVELTVDGVTKDFWVSRPPGLDAVFRPVTVGNRTFEAAYDFDRKDLGFSLFLKKFKVGFDPGTQQAATFTSEVTLTDEAKGIKERPVTIWMNNPLTHRDYTFYQSSYERLTDPATGQETGEFQSVLQVGHDAGRPLKYLGSLLIVLGTFLQFYMRAGLFTDGGAKEKAVAAERARRKLAKLGGTPPPPVASAKKSSPDDKEDIL